MGQLQYCEILDGCFYFRMVACQVEPLHAFMLFVASIAYLYITANRLICITLYTVLRSFVSDISLLYVFYLRDGIVSAIFCISSRYFQMHCIFLCWPVYLAGVNKSLGVYHVLQCSITIFARVYLRWGFCFEACGYPVVSSGLLGPCGWALFLG